MQSNNNTYWCYFGYVIWIEMWMSMSMEKANTFSIHIHMCMSLPFVRCMARIPIFTWQICRFLCSSHLSAHTFKCRHFCMMVCLFAVVNDSHSCFHCDTTLRKYECEKCMETGRRKETRKRQEKTAHTKHTPHTARSVIPLEHHIHFRWYCVHKMFAKFSNLSYSCHVRIICCLSFLRLLFAAVAISLYLDCCYSTIVIRNVCVSVFIPFHLIPFHSIFPVQVIKIPNKKTKKKTNNNKKIPAIHRRKYANVLFAFQSFRLRFGYSCL